MYVRPPFDRHGGLPSLGVSISECLSSRFLSTSCSSSHSYKRESDFKVVFNVDVVILGSPPHPETCIHMYTYTYIYVRLHTYRERPIVVLRPRRNCFILYWPSQSSAGVTTRSSMYTYVYSKNLQVARRASEVEKCGPKLLTDA